MLLTMITAMFLDVASDRNINEEVYSPLRQKPYKNTIKNRTENGQTIKYNMVLYNTVWKETMIHD